MCGIIGVALKKGRNAVPLVPPVLRPLQGRGEDGAGIATIDPLYCYKSSGRIDDVLTPDIIKEIPAAQIAVGHTRYATSGAKKDPRMLQPFATNGNPIWGTVAIVHNGNLLNHFSLRARLSENGAKFTTEDSDSEVFAHLIGQSRQPTPEKAVKEAVRQVVGSFALIAIFKGMLIAIKDPFGIRPLCYGVTPDGGYIVASESAALVGAKYVRELKPGEMLVFEPGKKPRSYFPFKGRAEKPAACALEWIYLKRPDSWGVAKSRFKAGELLAKKYPPPKGAIVVPVPDSANFAAAGIAKQSGLPLVIAIVKNHYKRVGRTFIQPTQDDREKAVWDKFIPVVEMLRGKKVVLVEDSIVRGTTLRILIKILWEAGVKEIHVYVTSPPVVGSCHLGIDIANDNDLVAFGRKIKGVRKEIGATSLVYLKPKRLVRSIGQSLCLGCFGKGYPIARPEKGDPVIRIKGK